MTTSSLSVMCGTVRADVLIQKRVPVAQRTKRAPERAVALALDEVRPAAGAAREPAARHGLLAGVELDRVGPVGVQVAQERVLPAREREERDRGGDPDVDADHAG